MKTKAKPSRKKGKGTGKCVAPFPLEFRLKVAKLRRQKVVGAAQFDYHPETEIEILFSFVVIDIVHVSF